MFWVFHQFKNPGLDIFYRAGLARTPDEFEHAISGLTAPGLSFSYADNKGNIAWWGTGRLPIRPDHVNAKDILDGSSGRDEILGYVPFEKNPRLTNPKSGIIVAANNRPTDQPVGPVRDLAGYWRPSDRAARITELLSQKEKWNLTDLRRVQTDDKTDAAPDMVARHGAHAIACGSDGLRTLTDIERAAYERLNAWDGRNDIGSVGFLTESGIDSEIFHIFFCRSTEIFYKLRKYFTRWARRWI